MKTILKVETPDADPGEVNALAQDLRAEAEERPGIESAHLAEGAALPGSKAVSAAEIGTLLLTLAEHGGISALGALIKGWLDRNGGCSLVLQVGEERLELKGYPPEVAQALVEEFLRRRAPAR